MITFALCATHQDPKYLGFFQKRLYDEAEKIFDRVLLLNPSLAQFRFHEGRPAQILYNGAPLEDVHVFMNYAGLGGLNHSLTLLAATLRLNGTVLTEPLAAYSGDGGSKTLNFPIYHAQGVGIDAALSFNLEDARAQIDHYAQVDAFPLLSKPVAGRMGQGVVKLSTVEKAWEFAWTFFDERTGDAPLVLQRFIQLAEEYRVLSLDDRILGIIRRERTNPQAATAAGRTKADTLVDAPDVAAFTKEHVFLDGLLGTDVARSLDGRLYLLESNPQPGWDEFESRFQMNIARELIQHAYQLYQSKQ